MEKHQNKWLALAVALLISVGTLSALLLRSHEEGLDTVTAPTKVKFALEKKTERFKSSTPEHKSTFAGVPILIVINTNTNLIEGSTVSVTNNKKEYGTGQTIIDPLKLSMRRSFDPSAPDGLYTVSYKACHQGISCSQGKFQFAIDRSLSKSFTDLRGKSEVTVSMKKNSFKENNIRVSKGTKVTWVNNDKVEHWVNTEAHLSNTYFPRQNSGVIEKGSQFSVVFDQAGAYPYHCSAHYPKMAGMIVVE